MINRFFILSLHVSPPPLPFPSHSTPSLPPSMMSQYFLMNYSLSAWIYPIHVVDFEVVGTRTYNGLSGFALKRL